MNTIPLLVAGDPDQATGGYLYDARIADALRRLGQPVATVGLAGRFPDADADAAKALAAALADRPDASIVLIDGLVLGGLPEVVAEHAGRLRIVALVHHPLADESGLEPAPSERLYASEQRALACAAHVVVTSRFTARRLIDRYDVDPALLTVVEPGVDKPATRSKPPSGTPRLLCVAHVIPRKGHVVLVEALARIADLDWRCDCLGDAQRDPGCARKVRAAIQRHGLSGRLHLTGRQVREHIAAAYRQAHLFVLPSWYEGYGMAVSEALAHGLPVVTTTGGALADTLPADAGLAVAPGDAEALAAALRTALTDTQLRARLAAGARRAADALPDWPRAGQRLAAVLASLGAPS